MNVSKKIETQIEGFKFDVTFGYEQLNITKAEYQTAAKVMERLQKRGIVKKLSKGVFYKPKTTIFGDLKPNDQEILRSYLFINGKQVAYITGEYLYNQLGLTTQMAFRIKIASRSKRIYINTGAIKASPVKSYAEVTGENYEMLGFLDAMKDLKIIPDIDINAAINIFRAKIKQLNEKQVKELIDYAMLYPPRSRAILGAILEQLNSKSDLKKLRDSLNPLTKFNLGISPNYLKTAINWNIE